MQSAEMLDRDGHVLVVGAAALDIKGYAAGPLQSGTSNQGRIRTSVGGVGRNIAENLARLGVSTVLLSAVGDDEAGRRLINQAAQSGVDTSHVLIAPDARTGAYLAVLDERGLPVLSIDDMAILQQLTPRYLYDHRRLFRDASLVVVDANLTPAALKTLFRLAEQYQRPVCADPTAVGLAPRLHPYLDRLFILTPNVTEAEALLQDRPIQGRDDAIAAAQRLVAMGVDLAIITMAERGLCYATSDESGHIPALDIEVVDFTGAGDALTAAVIFGLMEGFPVGEAVRLGVSAAALTLQCRETVYPELSLEKLYDQLVI